MTLNCKKDLIEVNGKSFPCSTSLAMSFIGGKWKTVILFHLKNGKKRYNELRKEMPTVTEHTLSNQLKQLQKDGLISRRVYKEKPPLKVVYQLTAFGLSSIPALDAITNWGNSIATEKGKIIQIAP